MISNIVYKKKKQGEYRDRVKSKESVGRGAAHEGEDNEPECGGGGGGGGGDLLLLTTRDAASYPTNHSNHFIVFILFPLLSLFILFINILFTCNFFFFFQTKNNTNNLLLVEGD